MIRTTLAQLVKKSQVIVLGHVHEGSDQSTNTASNLVSFDVAEVLKGPSDMQPRTLVCNYHPDSEWPDISRLRGDNIIFASPIGECLRLSVGYRSVTPIDNGIADTGGITGQPARQPLTTLRARIKALVSHENRSFDH
jgi:hypothetical protein